MTEVGFLLCSANFSVRIFLFVNPFFSFSSFSFHFLCGYVHRILATDFLICEHLWMLWLWLCVYAALFHLQLLCALLCDIGYKKDWIVAAQLLAFHTTSFHFDAFYNFFCDVTDKPFHIKSILYFMSERTRREKSNHNRCTFEWHEMGKKRNLDAEYF